MLLEGAIWKTKLELIILMNIALLELQLSDQLRAEHTSFIERIDATVKLPINGSDLIIRSEMPQTYWRKPLENASETNFQAGWQDNLTASDLKLQETHIQPEEVGITSLPNREATNERLDSAGLSPLMRMDL